MTSFAIDGVGAADGACVGGGLVGEGGKAMRSSVSEMEGRGAEGLRAIGITCLGTSGAGGPRGEKSHSSTNGNVWAIRAPVDKPLASCACYLLRLR